jgi:hypothetical protein
VDRRAAEDWIRLHVEPAGAIELVHERPWATVLRVPLAGGTAWFKACAPVQAFEPALTAGLAARWPGRVPEVFAHDEERAWLLLADAGIPLGSDTPPESWLAVLPAYAELQRGETAHAAAHLAHGVPDLRLALLAERYDELVARDLPLEPEESAHLRAFAPRFAALSDALAAFAIGNSVQHDDLHGGNVYTGRVLDWGDSSIAHPFTSLVVTFRFLEERRGLEPDDPWFARLRDAYLEPWGDGLSEAFALALRVGRFAHAIAWTRQRDHLPKRERLRFDRWYSHILRRALDQTAD